MSSLGNVSSFLNWTYYYFFVYRNWIKEEDMWTIEDGEFTQIPQRRGQLASWNQV